MSYLFPPSRSLLYPQFETYRILSSDPDVLSFPLPSQATQSRVGHGNGQTLSFQEVRSRIGWDHLAVGTGGRGIYVDIDWNVVGFELNSNTLHPTFSVLQALPTPLSTTLTEYPTSSQLDPTHWLISAGTGSLYILQTSPLGQPFTGSFVARYDTSSPVQVHGSIQSTNTTGETTARFLCTRALRKDQEVKNEGSSSRRRTRPRPTEFELIQLEIKLDAVNDVDKGENIEPVWVLRGNDLPFWCGWWEGGWIILSEAGFVMGKQTEEEESEEDRVKREREEKIGRLGLGARLYKGDEDVAVQVDQVKEGKGDDTSSKPTTSPVAGGEEARTSEQLYSWTQDSSSINIEIPLHALTRSDISVALTSETLTLSPTPSSSSITLPLSLSRLLSSRPRTLWGEIDVSLSTWTFDNSHLSISLAKIEESGATRWPSVFSPDEMDEDDGNEDLDVPETLDESILGAVREGFNAVKTREEGDPAGAHPGIPALLREEMDFDLEDDPDESDVGGMFERGSSGIGSGKVGREVLIGFVTESGEASWSKQTTAVLSTPLSVGGHGKGKSIGIIVKSAVDGLLFTPKPGSNPATTPWIHVSTNPALAFVISSKRDLRQVRHLSSSASNSEFPTSSSGGSTSASMTGSMVFAFDAGASSIGTGNLYVYHPPKSKTTAGQGVVGICGGERGMLLGVGGFSLGSGGDHKDGQEGQVVVGLCEWELVVIRRFG